MERLRELECDVETNRGTLKGILAAAAKDKRPLSAAERKSTTDLIATIEDLAATIRAERAALDFDRNGARAIDRPAGERDITVAGDEDRAALALPPLPERTRRKLLAVHGAIPTPAARQEHFRAVVGAALGGNPFDPALRILAASGSEGVPSEGGFAVSEEYSTAIWGRAAEASVWMRIGARVETMNSETKNITALDDDDESSDAEAALSAGWTGEAVDLATPQVMKLRGVVLRAKKLMIVAAGSNELGEDGPAYFEALEQAIARGIGKKFDRAILSGTGAGQPMGILVSPATITVAKTVNGDPGVANTFTWNHAVGMWARLSPGSHEKAWWLLHPTVLPQALSMGLAVKNVAGTENVGGFQPVSAFTAGGPTGYMLLGRPVVITGRVKTLSTAGDVILCDPTQYAVGIRRQLTIDRSPHVYFTSDRIAVRGKFRGDGLPLWDTTRTLQEGSTTVSPFVILAAR